MVLELPAFRLGERPRNFPLDIEVFDKFPGEFGLELSLVDLLRENLLPGLCMKDFGVNYSDSPQANLKKQHSDFERTNFRNFGQDP